MEKKSSKIKLAISKTISAIAKMEKESSKMVSATSKMKLAVAKMILEDGFLAKNDKKTGVLIRLEPGLITKCCVTDSKHAI